MAKEKEEKEPKPKKSFEMKVIVWDDGEVQTELYEYRENPSGRGAPGKWRLSKTDFVRRIEETMANPASNLLEDVYDGLGRDVSDTSAAKEIVGNAVKAVVTQDYSVEVTEKPSKKKKKEITEEITEEIIEELKAPEVDPDPKDMDFGSFDTTSEGDEK